ncbi:MAG: serine--tRNA ligase, partial [Actinomycetes bacterium]
MIDVNVLRDTPDIVRASATARGEDPALVDEVLAADTARRQALLSFETQRAEQKTLGKQVASATGDAKAELLTRTKELSVSVKEAEATVRDADERFNTALLGLSNVVDPAAP